MTSRTQQQSSPGARDILNAVASGRTDADALGLRGNGKRVLAAMVQGKLLRKRVVTKLELTEAGRDILQGASPLGKRAAASHGIDGGAAKRGRGRPRDPDSARSRAFDMLKLLEGSDLPRKDKIASLAQSLGITPMSASTYIHEYTKEAEAAATAI